VVEKVVLKLMHQEDLILLEDQEDQVEEQLHKLELLFQVEQVTHHQLVRHKEIQEEILHLQIIELELEEVEQDLQVLMLHQMLVELEEVVLL
jgi:hypothetical protein